MEVDDLLKIHHFLTVCLQKAKYNENISQGKGRVLRNTAGTYLHHAIITQKNKATSQGRKLNH